MDIAKAIMKAMDEAQTALGPVTVSEITVTMGSASTGVFSTDRMELSVKLTPTPPSPPRHIPPVDPGKKLGC